MPTRICYVSSRYMSFARAAHVYRKLIAEKYEIVSDLDSAHIVILHLPPDGYARVYRTFPSMAQKYVIGCCVWEASELPEAYEKGMSYIQEVWTCSRYCCDIFQRYHPRVVYMPYVIDRDLSCSTSDRAFVKEATSYNPGLVYYLSVTKLWDRRKNVAATVRAFQRLREAMPMARLVIKTPPGELSCVSWNSDPRIILLLEQVTDSQINALYELADVYISAHHSEGWGFTLSDGMLFQKPVIATGYSGNLEFMNNSNSFLLDFTESNIRPEDCFFLFRTNMKWAYPSEEDLEKKLLFLYERLSSEFVQEKVRKASDDVSRFSRSAVAQLIHERLREILGESP